MGGRRDAHTCLDQPWGDGSFPPLPSPGTGLHLARLSQVTLTAATIRILTAVLRGQRAAPRSLIQSFNKHITGGAYYVLNTEQARQTRTRAVALPRVTNVATGHRKGGCDSQRGLGSEGPG